MTKDIIHQIPIRSKLEMAKDIAEIMHCYHQGQSSALDLLVEDLKYRCSLLDETIQHDVLMFVEQIQFQYAYDEWHPITPEIQSAADRLIEDLGLRNR